MPLWVTLLALVPALLGGTFHACVANRPTLDLQVNPGWLSQRSDRTWRATSMTLVNEIKNRREDAHKQLLAELKRLPTPTDLPETDESELVTEGTYGQLPTVMVDQGHAAIFPLPLSRPHRFSWYQVALASRRALRTTRHLESGLRALRSASEKDRPRLFQSLSDSWNELNARFTNISQEYRYLESWVPQLERNWNDEKKQGRAPANDVLVHAILSEDPRLMEPLREILKPRRVLSRPFLADDLEDVPGGIITLPIVTDVSDRKFIAEVEGALSTHWNQSPWARQHAVHFVIRWTHVPRNRAFAAGKETLAQHLAHFPDDKAAMTTGGLTTYVKSNALILGPGKILPRTLAHELGHLMGFADCYLRTLSGQGIFGVAVLEWDNPLYPDDLMCDNTVGVPRAEVW